MVGGRAFEGMFVVGGDGQGNVWGSLVREVVERDLSVGNGIEAVVVAVEGIVVGTGEPVGRRLQVALIVFCDRSTVAVRYVEGLLDPWEFVVAVAGLEAVRGRVAGVAAQQVSASQTIVPQPLPN